MTEKRTCGACAHARAMPLTLGQSVQCRGAPPQIVITDRGPGAAFPIVPSGPDCVCGRWQPAPPIGPENLD